MLRIFVELLLRPTVNTKDVVRIIQLKAGFTSPVLLYNGEQAILVDTGPEGTMRELMRQFYLCGIDPSQIKLIILTHTHYDHTGNLQELKRLTGAQVVVNKREAEWLKTGLMPIPRGTNIWTRIVVGLGDLLMPGYASPKPFDADIFVDQRLELKTWGFDAEVILTPGHTEGSQSVITGKNLICGDTFFNFRWLSVYPPFANDERQLIQTWGTIMGMGIETIYPGHGPRFSIDKARDFFNRKLKNRISGTSS